MYLLYGKLTAKEGFQQNLADILIEASKLVATAQGCRQYLISEETGNLKDVFITEIWESKVDHDNSLQVPGVRELIAKAMPLLDGVPTKGQELDILGGHGI